MYNTHLIIHLENGTPYNMYFSIIKEEGADYLHYYNCSLVVLVLI